MPCDIRVLRGLHKALQRAVMLCSFRVKQSFLGPEHPRPQSSFTALRSHVPQRPWGTKPKDQFSPRTEHGTTKGAHKDCRIVVWGSVCVACYTASYNLTNIFMQPLKEVPSSLSGPAKPLKSSEQTLNPQSCSQYFLPDTLNIRTKASMRIRVFQAL